TTVALQLTEQLGGINTSFYMSTRVSDESLYNQFPWLRERIKQSAMELAGRQFSRTIDETPVGTEGATDISFELRIRGDRKATDPEMRKRQRTELERLEGRIEMGEEGAETYGKHGEGQVAEGTLVFDLGSDLPEIDMAYDAVEKNQPQKTLILIDSINALAERYGIHPSKLINTLQKDLVEAGQANVVFILEDSGETKLDYLGDGVVLFQSREHAGRRLRVMTIEKLRGRELRQHKFIYTLEGARIRAFDIRPTERPGEPNRWRAVPDRSKNEVSTGNEALDALIGGVRRATIVCLELGAGVPSESVDNLRLALICNFASLGRASRARRLHWAHDTAHRYQPKGREHGLATCADGEPRRLNRALWGEAAHRAVQRLVLLCRRRAEGGVDAHRVIATRLSLTPDNCVARD